MDFSYAIFGFSRHYCLDATTKKFEAKEVASSLF